MYLILLFFALILERACGFAAVQTWHFFFVLVQNNVSYFELSYSYAKRCDINLIIIRYCKDINALFFLQFFPSKILLQHNDFIVLMSLQSQFCTVSVHPGSGELIWATPEVWFSYIGPQNSSPGILQWLPAR